MSAVFPLEAAPVQDVPDQRVRLHAVGWADYEELLAMRGESSVPRVSYLEGELELMSPSADHERFKKLLARLLEAHAEEQGIELEGYGSWTLKSAGQARGLEADECYVIGPSDRKPERPDIAIEVIWTSGGIDKLAIYSGLGIPEVWIWQNDSLCFHLLEDGVYQVRGRSRLIPDLIPDRLLRCAEQPTQTAAVKAYRAALRGSA